MFQSNSLLQRLSGQIFDVDEFLGVFLCCLARSKGLKLKRFNGPTFNSRMSEVLRDYLHTPGNLTKFHIDIPKKNAWDNGYLHSNMAIWCMLEFRGLLTRSEHMEVGPPKRQRDSSSKFAPARKLPQKETSLLTIYFQVLC